MHSYYADLISLCLLCAGICAVLIPAAWVCDNLPEDPAWPNELRKVWRRE